MSTMNMVSIARRLAGVVCLLAFKLVLFTSAAFAHAGGENYVWLNVEEDRLSGRIEIAFSELEAELGISLPEDAAAREVAIREHAAVVQQYIRENLEISAGGRAIAYHFGEPHPAEGAENRFAAYPIETEPFDVPSEITLRNDLFLTWDRPLYRSLAVMEFDRQRDVEYPQDHVVLAFGPNSREQVLNLDDPQPILTTRDFVWQGVIHVLLGPDHVLFLLALLLTSVLRRTPDRQWVAVDRAAPAMLNALVVITLFALAHSATLSLTVLGLIQPNIRLIEALIAFSIAAVAANNLFPLFASGRWILIIFFGFFHGVGFASAMNELQFRMVEPAKILFNFNVGIEIGQIAIVAVVFPIIFLIRRTEFYRSMVFRFGNVVIALVALYWTITRLTLP